MTNYLENEKIKDLFITKSKKIEKTELTLGSTKPDNHSVIINGELITFVKDNKGNLLEETRNKIIDDVIIARNPNPIGEINGMKVYNEWLVPKSTWIKNYGTMATNEFKSYQKKSSIMAILIDDEILKILKSADGKTAKIKVDWNEEGMTVYKNGYLTDKGYAIAPEEYLSTYKELKDFD